MAKTKIPLFYDIYFRWGDLLITTITAYLTIFTPEKFLEQALSHAWTPSARIDPMVPTLMWQIAGLYCFIAIIQGGLLRYTDDIGVWKITNFGILVVDLLLLRSLYEMHAGAPGGFDLSTFRPSDWLNWGITALSISVRLAFIAGIGLGAETTQRSKKKQ